MPKHSFQSMKKHILCLTGVEKHHIERDLIKFLRKYLERDGRDLPIHSVHKKRKAAFAFLNFKSEEQKKEF